MRRIVLHSVAVLFLIGLASSVVGLFYLRRVYDRNEDVGPVRLDRKLGDYCTEASTTNDFDQFWSEFRTAVKSDNKDKLFAMVRACDFVWEGQPWKTEPTLKLKLADCVVGPLDDCQPWGYSTGARQVFQNRTDFDKNYDRIFTKAITDGVLNGVPWEESEGRYDVSWEPAKNETLSLTFERLVGIGYKFSGLEWVPEPVWALKLEAAKARRKTNPSASVAPQPNSTP
jgi:hypothetical protein